MELPGWIGVIDGANNIFSVDPDIIYAEWLNELDITEPTQYDLEIVYGCMKLDFDLHVRMAGKVIAGRSIIRHIRTDDGRKGRWNLTMHPLGAVDFNALPMKDRSRIIRENYKRIRGFIPTG